jgi:NifB/MoaA-like Fe-S oxidoreductase
LTLIFIFFFKKLEKDSIDKNAENLNNFCILMEEKVSGYMINNEVVELQDFIKGKSLNLKSRITVIDTSGKVIADTEEKPDFMDNHLDQTYQLL